MNNYPDYVHRLLAEAREEGQWYCGQYDAAAKCFDVLALFPDCTEAADLAYELFCDEWVIYDTRNALQQNIDEWDDRPYQQRRRLALAFRFLSRWDGKHDEDLRPHRGRGKTSELDKLLEKAHDRLLDAYCLGNEEATAYAWPLFSQAIAKARNPEKTLLNIGFQYADLGFFSDAVEVLAELCSRYNPAEARRLLAEVKWWRDNVHRLPWLPPAGDGSLYRRMMAKIEPDAPTDEEILQAFRERAKQKGDEDTPTWEPSISAELAALVSSSLPPLEAPAAPALVDWSFLQTDDGEPGELPEWAQKQIKLFGGRRTEIAQDIIKRAQYSRPIPPPITPKRYDPNEPPFDPHALMSELDFGDLDELEDIEDWEEDDEEDETKK
jgi:hypothetical protein